MDVCVASSFSVSVFESEVGVMAVVCWDMIVEKSRARDIWVA